MIMRRGHQLLLAANPWFIWSSLLAALAFNMLQNMGWWGRAAWVPDVLALVLLFWSIHQPRRIGIGTAFVFGILVDVHQGALLGQHALGYTVLGFLAVAIHLRLLWFSAVSQAFQVLPLFAALHAIEFLVRMLAGAASPGFLIVLAPFIESLLWPVISVLLLIPQRRTPEPDATRPL